jgi:hypothetical protein
MRLAWSNTSTSPQVFMTLGLVRYLHRQLLLPLLYTCVSWAHCVLPLSSIRECKDMNAHTLTHRRDAVTVDGLWVDGRMYWTFWYSAWIRFSFHCYTPVSTVTAVICSGFQRQTFPFLWVHTGSVASATSYHINSTQRLKRNIPLTVAIVVLRSLSRLLVAANVVLRSPILVTLMVKALCFSETSVQPASVASCC